MAIQAQFPASFAPQDFAAENGFVNNGNGGGGGGGGFNFFNTLEQQQQLFQSNLQQQLLLQQQRNNNNHNNSSNNNIVLGNGNFGFESLNRSNLNGVVSKPAPIQSNMVNPSLQTMAAFEQKQRQEIDGYIRLQNEKLRLMLQEQRKQQLAQLLKVIESKATVLLQQKDDEISRASKRATEMELLINRLEMENQAWQRIAKEKEAAVISLNNTIEQVRESSSLMMAVNHGEGDAESCCSGNEAENGDGLLCKGCNRRGACVLFLPCRHLCSCNVCDEFLDCCPVCQTPKKASIEALMA